MRGQDPHTARLEQAPQAVQLEIKIEYQGPERILAARLVNMRRGLALVEYHPQG